MSKKAKSECGYLEKPVMPVCGNCKHFTSEMRAIPWIAKELAENGRVDVFGQGRYTEEAALPDSLRIEGNKKCGLHGFAVKKTAACRDWENK